MDPTSDQQAFAQLVDALAPYLNDVVFVGGWGHRLFVFHDLASPLGFTPLATQDADVATTERTPRRGARIAMLLKSSGFREELRGEDRPPISRYHLGDGKDGFHAEFLVPLMGGATRRDGRPNDTTEVAGVSAQKLRHVDLLIERPWAVRLSEELGFPVEKPGRTVRVSTPASFIAQKLEVRSARALRPDPSTSSGRRVRAKGSG